MNFEKFEENFDEIGKFGDNRNLTKSPKFESLTLKSKIWNLTKSKIVTAKFLKHKIRDSIFDL